MGVIRFYTQCFRILILHPNVWFRNYLQLVLVLTAMSRNWRVFFFFFFFCRQISPKTTQFQWKWINDLALAKRCRLPKKKKKSATSLIPHQTENLKILKHTQSSNPLKNLPQSTVSKCLWCCLWLSLFANSQCLHCCCCSTVACLFWSFG